ncbi:DUF3124 domain-containing protein [Desulfovibrio sp.]
MRHRIAAVLAVIAVLCLSAAALAGSGRGKGQTIYVPLYSHVYQGLRDRPFDLSATLSVRNTDAEHPITLVFVDYYDTAGKPVRRYLDKAESVPPLATREFLVSEKDTAGGSGAKFLVRWTSDRPVPPPVVEAVMIGTANSQGISFLSTGRVISEE